MGKRAARIHEPIGPDAVQIEDVGLPVACDGMVLIDVRRAGVAFPDLLVSRGSMSHPLQNFGPGSPGLARSFWERDEADLFHEIKGEPNMQNAVRNRLPLHTCLSGERSASNIGFILTQGTR
ncbi:MAG: hypothetical protein WAO61_05665 [Solirubrobacterales bacterium]